MNKKINVSVSEIEHIETPDVSVYFATIRFSGEKRRRAFVKTSKKFEQKIMNKISEYYKNRQK